MLLNCNIAINTLVHESSQLASAHYDIGNTVVANNITAKARLGVWLVSRSVKGLQSITDGYMYESSKIYRLKNDMKSPGLETLSDYRKMEKHRSIKTTSLGEMNWE